ncbi:MAG: PKD domain-containing protein, partial [Deltaproteobacteria bacterium]|nr:PKD domain-containing protein [Deltaproteobacteria bacterium]
GLTTHALVVTANKPPQPAIKGPSQVRIDETASFSGSGSTDSDGAITDYEWDFDYDGNNFDVQATGPTVNNGWPLAGSYLVALRVTDNDGDRAVATAALEVTPNQPPVAVIQGPSAGDIGQLLSFSGSSSSDPDGKIAAHEWDFDYDGQNFDVEESGAAVNHAYQNAGAYTVALRVTDNDGATDIATLQVSIEQLSVVTITNISPSSGPRQGGTTVVIAGTAFTSAKDTLVTFGAEAAKVLAVTSSTEMTVLAPAGVPGPADVKVKSSKGTAVALNGYTYAGASNRANAEYCWVDATAGQSVGFAPGSDDANRPVQLPFDFVFYAELFPAGAELRVATNGWASFTDTSGQFAHFAIPSASNPKNLLAPLFMDLNVGNAGVVYSRVVGSPPDRRLVVQWDAVRDNVGAGEIFTFQLVLYEASHDIVFQYRNTAAFDGWVFNDRESGAEALIGIQNADGSDGEQLSRSAFLSGLAPGGRVVVFEPKPAGGYDFDTTTTLNVAGTSTPPGATLPTGGTITLYLSRPIDVGSVTAGTNVYLRRLATAAKIPTNVSFSPAKDTMYVQPGVPLFLAEQYSVTVESSVKDPEGQPLSQDPMQLSCGAGSPTNYTSSFYARASVVATINTGGGTSPWDIKLDPGGSRMWVTAPGSDDLLELSVAGRSLSSVGTSWPAEPRGLALRGTMAYSANMSGRSTTRLSIAGSPAVWSAWTDLNNSGCGNGMFDLAINASGSRAYYSCWNDRIATVNLGAMTQCDNNGGGANWMYDPAGGGTGRAIATRPGDDARYFYAKDDWFLLMRAEACDGVTSDWAEVTRNIPGTSWDIVASATRAYVSDSSWWSRVYVIGVNPGDGATYGQIVATIDYPDDSTPQGLALSPDGTILAVTLDGTNELSLVRTSNNTEIDTDGTGGMTRVPLGNCDPQNVAIVQPGSYYEYWITCPPDNQVVVVQ